MIALAMLIAAAAADPRCASVKTDDLIGCAAADLRQADAALNAAYRDAMAKARGEESASARAANGGAGYAQTLVASERAWLAYRDAQCRLETYGSWDGHELPIYQRACLTEVTKMRARQLRALVAPR